MSGEKPNVEHKWVWPITFLIWGIGCGVIYLLWTTKLFANDTAESIFGFVLFIVAFFYFLAIGPIRDYVSEKLK